MTFCTTEGIVRASTAKPTAMADQNTFHRAELIFSELPAAVKNWNAAIIRNTTAVSKNPTNNHPVNPCTNSTSSVALVTIVGAVKGNVIGLALYAKQTSYGGWYSSRQQGNNNSYCSPNELCSCLRHLLHIASP